MVRKMIASALVSMAARSPLGLILARKDQSMFRNILFSNLFLLAVVAVAFAQQPKYKVGDRVEVDTNQSNTPAYASWKHGTITQVDTGTAMAYTVRVDPAPGKLPAEVHIPIRPYAEGWLRPLGGGAAPKIESAKLRVDDRNTVLADREVLDCKNLKAGPARNGQPAPTELVKKLIRCTFESPSDPGQDGARTMDIVGFTADGTRRWNRAEYQGMHATAATIIYIFHVKYNKKTFYRTTTESETGSVRNFACYVDGTEWYCGTAAGGVKDGEKKSIPAKR